MFPDTQHLRWLKETGRREEGHRDTFWSSTFTQGTKKTPAASHIFIIELVQAVEEEEAGTKLPFCCRCSYWPYDCRFMMRIEERIQCP